MLQEIIRPVPKDNRTEGDPCPYCDIPTHWQSIECPEGRSGCLVLHYGFHCDRCGRDFYGYVGGA